MPPPPVDIEQLKAAIAAVEAHDGDATAAAGALAMSRNTLQSWISRAVIHGLTTREHLTALRNKKRHPRMVAAMAGADVHEAGPVHNAVNIGTDPLSTNAYEAEWRIFAREIGMAKDRYNGPCKRPARIGRRKLLIVPDVHAPHHDRAQFAAMLEREKDADHAVVMGDIGDGYALSTFLKYESVPYEQELAAVEVLLEQLSERYPEVDLIEGNHDGPRLEKRLRERLSSDMIAAIVSMTGGTLSPIEALCRRRFPNVRLASHTVGRHEVKWFTQIGDAIFCHAEKFSRVPGSALRAVEEWFSDNEHKLDLKPWRVLVLAHTHQMGVFPWRADKLLIECGCLATSPGYAVGARIGGRPQRGGYVTFEQVDGWTDFNSVRPVWLEQVEPRTA